MPRIASKHPGSAISHSHRDVLSTCLGRAHPHILYAHTHTHNHVRYHTHTHTHCLWKPGFSSSAFLIRHCTLLNERPLVSDSLLFLFISLLSSLSLRRKKKRNHTSSISVPAFLLFPRQQWQRIFPRRTQPMALAVVWVVVLLGSVELAACVSAYLMLMHVCGWADGGGGRWHVHVCTLARMHSCPHAFVHDDVWMSAAGSCLCVRGSCTVFMRETACETRRANGCQGIFKALEKCFLNHFN